MCHASKERELMFGTRSADYIRASGHNGCINRPNTWLHPNASLKCPIFSLAPRAPSIHGTSRHFGPCLGGPLLEAQRTLVGTRSVANDPKMGNRPAACG